jgi:glycosyltransferase involved in cell wall biosynthesis
MPNKTIWIINQYASTPETSIGGRHFHLARELALRGHTIYLIAASYTHVLRNPPIINENYEIKLIDNIYFVWIKVPFYSNAHSKKRILNWFIFSIKLLFLTKLKINTPNVILMSSPSLIPFLSAVYIARKLKIRLVFEVRDIWPLTFIELGGYSKNNPFIRFLQWIEDKAYRDADRIISNLPMSWIHMVNRGMEKTKFTWIPNGFSRDDIQNLKQLDESVKNQIPSQKFIIGYAGTIGTANALEYLIEAANILKYNREIMIIIVGDGRTKSSLIDLKKLYKLNNVIFINSIPKDQVQSLLSLFDICYIGWRNHPIYRYGISANKIFEYLVSEKPILHSYSGVFDIIKEGDCGLTVPAEDPQAIAKSILEFKSMNINERIRLGKNGKKYAEQNFDYSKLATKLFNVLFNKSEN